MQRYGAQRQTLQDIAGKLRALEAQTDGAARDLVREIAAQVEDLKG